MYKVAFEIKKTISYIRDDGKAERKIGLKLASSSENTASENICSAKLTARVAN